jgi:hypothetical protein
MKTQKLIFLFCLIGILILLLISNSQKSKTGKIKLVSYSENKITIELENKIEKLIIFDNKILNIKAGDEIYFIGKKDDYKNETQIIVDKIEK